MEHMDQATGRDRQPKALTQDRGDLLERDPKMLMEDDDERDRLWTEVHAGGPKRVRRLQRMAALDTLTTHRAAPDLHVEPTHDGPHEGDIFLILRRDAGYVGSTAQRGHAAGIEAV
jgi:hypothetical protein